MMLTETTCPHCKQRVAHDAAGHCPDACPKCSGSLRVSSRREPLTNAARKPSAASPSQVLGKEARVRVMGQNLERSESVYGLSRTPAPEASFGGMVQDAEATTERERRRRDVEVAVAKTQSRVRRRVRLRPWVWWSIVAASALVVGGVAGLLVVIL